MAEGVTNTVEPVRQIPPDGGKPGPKPGIGLCLSGGGYRAMLFHVGTLWRLYDTGVLQRLDRISSVSGGSITAAHLGLNFDSLLKLPQKPDSFLRLIADPIRALANRTIDAGAVLGGILLPGSISDKVASSYRKHLFGDKTLQQLSDKPRFVINSTNVQTGALWRFSKPYMADYRVGKIEEPDVPIATAVAASSAFPPILSPVELHLDPAKVMLMEGCDLHEEPYTSMAVLSDGGVYDNLGLETVWKEYQTVLVSDAGARLEAEPDPKRDWGRHAFRILNLIDNQVRALRKRQLIDAFKQQLQGHTGAYWGIGSDYADYPITSRLQCPAARTLELAGIATRLKQLPAIDQERLINWGYAVTDAALRSHLPTMVPAGDIDFPYPATGV